MKKHIIVFLLTAFFILSSSPGFTAGCKGPSDFCIGLVTDVGVIDDKSFNQSTWEGAKQAASILETHCKYIETKDAKDYMTNIDLFAKNGYKVIITVGFALGEATVQAAAKYPDIKFIGVDQFQPKAVPNVAGLIFHEDQAGFKAGALAAMLTKSKIVAAVLATDMIPPIVNFNKGYEAGVGYIDPSIKIISTFHPGGLDVAFTDPEWGAATARQALDQGADVVFALGGLTGNGGLIEVAAHKGKYCIGVDTDQYETLPESRPCLVSCALKLITPAVVELIKRAKNNSFPSGNYFGGVGLSPFHGFEKTIPASVKKRLIEIDKGINNGSIKVSK